MLAAVALDLGRGDPPVAAVSDRMEATVLDLPAERGGSEAEGVRGFDDGHDRSADRSMAEIVASNDRTVIAPMPDSIYTLALVLSALAPNVGGAPVLRERRRAQAHGWGKRG